MDFTLGGSVFIDEFINLRFLNLITHHNGWSMTWSVIFNAMMFPMLWLYYKKPGTALLLSIPIVAFLLGYFRVPIYRNKSLILLV